MALTVGAEAIDGNRLTHQEARGLPIKALAADGPTVCSAGDRESVLGRYRRGGVERALDRHGVVAFAQQHIDHFNQLWLASVAKPPAPRLIFPKLMPPGKKPDSSNFAPARPT